MAKRHKSTKDLIEDTFAGEDEEFGKEIVEYVEARRLGKMLSIMREHAGLTQSEVAEKAHWGQPKISKIESQADDEFSLEELRKYLAAIGFTMEINFLPRSMILAEKVKYHWGRMFEALKKISGLAGKDSKIQDGINKFMIDAASNILSVSAFCLESVQTKQVANETIEINEPEFLSQEVRGRERHAPA